MGENKELIHAPRTGYLAIVGQDVGRWGGAYNPKLTRSARPPRTEGEEKMLAEDREYREDDALREDERRGARDRHRFELEALASAILKSDDQETAVAVARIVLGK